MKEFFKVETIENVLAHVGTFPVVGTEDVPITQVFGRILAEDILSDIDIPDFNRSTMDGFAVGASSTFGASEANPAYLSIVGKVNMGDFPDFDVGPGEAAAISTGGMLPERADSVIMVEHTDHLDETTIEAYKSVAPGQNIIEKGEDVGTTEAVLTRGMMVRPQEAGLLAASGKENIRVFKKPIIGIISTGDEIVSVGEVPGAGRIRDINTHTLYGQVQNAGGTPVTYGIVKDNYDDLKKKCKQALEASDMVLISGGSSVGARDFTVDVLNAIDDTQILVHGISISPGKPTILARSGQKAFWGLPGHVVSAMVVFSVVVKPFIQHISGTRSESKNGFTLPANLTRNLASAQGRVDFVRVRLKERQSEILAEPILGKSGLINTMVKADGLIRIDMNTEGLEKGTIVPVMLL